MHKAHWMTSLLLTSALFTACAIAADATPATTQAQAKQTGKLDKISDTPVAAATPGMKECEHKNGEPCPYHQNEKHHRKAHEKCDYKHPG
jgi:hypothetical protein